MTALLLAFGCGSAKPSPTTAATEWRYEVRVAPGLSTAHVRGCFDGPAPARLVPVRGEPGQWTSAFDARGRRLEVDSDAIDLDGVGSSSCVRWVARLDEAARRTRHVRRSGDDILTAHSAWLWRPAQLPARSRATVRFSLPEGHRVVTPWPVREDGAHVLGRSALMLGGDVAFGRFEVDELRVAGGRLRLVRLDGRLDASAEDVRSWIRASAEAVSSLYGRFPVERATLMVMPVGPGPDPVAFGRVRRGGGSSVLLLVRRNAQLESLLGGWVAVHELAHLLLPLLERQDAWISEGIATYYQEILRARAGLQTPAEAWHRLDRGLSRARASGTDRTLTEEADEMRHTGAHQRVYWSGAAFALQLDVRLRELTDGRESLGSVLESLRGLSERRVGPWKGETVLRMLDRAAGHDVCSALGARYAYARSAPEADSLFASVGLVRGPSGQLASDGTEPAAQLRASITRETGRAYAHRVDVAPAR